MRIGNQTAVGASDPFDPYRFALAHGFRAFEWFADRHGDRGFDFGLVDPTARAGLRRRGKEADLRYTVHAAWYAQPFDEAGAAALHEAIGFAGDVGATLVVLHLRAGPANEALVEALQPMIAHAHGVGVRLALENEPATPPEQFNDLFDRLAARHQAGHRVGACFDMGHANLHPATRNDYVRYFDALGDHVPVIHVHAHENFGDADKHLPIGHGPSGDNPAGLRALLARLGGAGYDGALIMEQWPDPPEMLLGARDLIAAHLPG